MGTSLKRLWAEVRRDFDQAMAHLPTPTLEDEGSMERLADWLDHNELGLALDELELLGLDNAAQDAFWKTLVCAAARMGLTEKQARLTRRCTGTDNCI
jgi:hypothetical protein